jgi:hypothetical protein
MPPFKVFTLVLLTLLMPLGQVGAFEEGEDKSYVRVQKYQELVYEIEGNNFFGNSTEIRIGEKYFSEDIVANKKYTFLPGRSRYSKKAKEPEPNTLNLNHFAENALSLVFAHPDKIKYEEKDGNKELRLHFAILYGRDNNKKSTYTDSLRFKCKSKTNSSGWSHELYFVKDEALLFYFKEMGYSFSVDQMRILINTKWDKKENRVKSATVKYETIFGKLSGTSPPIKIQKIDKKFKSEFKLKYKETVAGVTKIQDRIDRAVDMSHHYIRKNLEDLMNEKRDYYFHSSQDYEQIGISGLMLYALLNSGLDPNKKEGKSLITAYFSWLAKHGYKASGIQKQSGSRAGNVVYTASILLMMIDTMLTDPTPQKGKYRIKFRVSGKLRGQALGLAKACLKIIDGPSKGHLWDYDGTKHFKAPGAYSRAQYAVLGLRSAVNLKLKLQKPTWNDILPNVMKDAKLYTRTSTVSGNTKEKITFGKKSVLYHHKILSKDKKGWSYTNESGPSFNMTCSGLGALIMSASNLNKGQISDATKKTMYEGLLYLQRTLDYEPDKINFYQYYSFERVAMLYGIELFGGEDWHVKMSENILSQQTATGKFRAAIGGSYNDLLLSNAYGLLFLKKATKPIRQYETGFKD